MINDLKKLQKGFVKASKIPQQNNKSVPLDELLTDSFINKISNFSTLNDFFAESGLIDFSNLDDVNEQDLDAFVKENTQCSSWEDLLSTALQHRIQNQLDDAFR